MLSAACQSVFSNPSVVPFLGLLPAISPHSFVTYERKQTAPWAFNPRAETTHENPYTNAVFTFSTILADA